MIVVLGHKTPDTDAIVSSIVFTEYLNKTGHPATAGSLGELNNETKFILKYWSAEAPKLIESLPEGAQVALVDHNEKKQSYDDLDHCVVTHIVDHHKFNLQTASPLYIYAYPFGCTATILYRMFEADGLEISKKTAGLMLSAIISDTLLFRSPTTTKTDKQTAEILAGLAELDNLENYAEQMFAAKSDLSGKSTRDILLSDFKQFELAGNTVGVGVFETTSPFNVLAIATKLNQEMTSVASEMKLDHFLFSVVDIIESKNYMFGVHGESELLIAQAFDATQDQAGYFLLDGVVSRKKQIIPKIEAALS